MDADLQRAPWTVRKIPPLDQEAMTLARARQDKLTKPPGSLGRLETLSVQLAGMTSKLSPRFQNKVVIVMAGDHGVTARGVSAYPREVTAQMVANFLRGGAAINVLARHSGSRVVVVDIGVAADMPSHPDLVSRKVAHGTQDFTQGPAMTRAQALQALDVGMEITDMEAAKGLDLVAPGDMGIGNTTASSALIAAITGAPAETVTGRGTGISEEARRHKVRVIQSALQLHMGDMGDTFGMLARLGGLEIAGLAGVCLAAAAKRVPVVIDGLISSAAAMVAASIAPEAKAYFIASHRSVEPGHQVALSWLGLEPLLDLNLRLGEGTGAVLAFPIIQAAANLLGEMATFDEAGVSEASDE